MYDMVNFSVNIAKIEDNFVKDYEFWNNLIKSINFNLKNYDNTITLFEYNEFCISFLKELEKDIQNWINQI